MRLTLDAEANGLLDVATHIHCVVVHAKKGPKWIFTDRSDEIIGEYPGYEIVPLEELEEVLEASTQMICHNELAYDLKLFLMLLGIEYEVNPDTINGHKTVFTDTLVLSRAMNPDRTLPGGCPDYMEDSTGKKTKIGPHGLKSWSFRVDGTKPEVEDWEDQPIDTYIVRCIEDVKTNEKTYDYLVDEAKGHSWKQAMQIAHPAYHLMCKQEDQGIYFDVEKAEELLIVIDDMMTEIEEFVEPQLPLMKITKSKLKHPPKNQFKKDGMPSALCLKYFGKVEEVKGVVG